MDGFSGFKTATAEELPDAVAVMDPFHVVRLAGDALDRAAAGCSRTCTATAAAPATRSTGRGGPCTPAPTCSPTSRQHRLEALFAVEEHVEVEATWGIYQRMIGAYRDPDRKPRSRADAGRHRRRSARGVPAALTELRHPRPHAEASGPPTCWPTSTGPAPATDPTEAINGRLEHLRGSALGFRNLTNFLPLPCRRSRRPTAESGDRRTFFGPHELGRVGRTSLLLPWLR